VYLCGNDRTVGLDLVPMEVRLRLAKAQTRKVSTTRPIAMEKEKDVQLMK